MFNGQASRQVPSCKNKEESHDEQFEGDPSQDWQPEHSTHLELKEIKGLGHDDRQVES
jgi:hypothetical protein